MGNSCIAFATVLFTIIMLQFAPPMGLTLQHIAYAQPSEPAYTVHEFVAEPVIVEGTVRLEISWNVEINKSSSYVALDLRDGAVHVWSANVISPEPGRSVTGNVVDTRLTSGSSTTYRLVLTNGSGDVATHELAVRVPGPPLLAPPGILAGSLISTTDTTATAHLTWDELTGDENTGYTEITGYDIQYRFGDDGEWTPVSPAPSGTTRGYEHALSVGSANRAELQYQIRATNLITELEGGPQGPWSETVSPMMVSMDLNTDGSIGGDDMLILYYSLELEDEFESDTYRNTSTVGPLVNTLIGGLLRSTEFTDADVLAAWDRALLLEEFGGSAIGSINASSGIDADDALILYYAAAFRDLLGDGRSGGFESMRRALLTQPSRLTDPTDVPLKAVLQSANDFLNRYR